MYVQYTHSILSSEFHQNFSYRIYAQLQWHSNILNKNQIKKNKFFFKKNLVIPKFYKLIHRFLPAYTNPEKVYTEQKL